MLKQWFVGYWGVGSSLFPSKEKTRCEKDWLLQNLWNEYKVSEIKALWWWLYKQRARSKVCCNRYVAPAELPACVNGAWLCSQESGNKKLGKGARLVQLQALQSASCLSAWVSTLGRQGKKQLTSDDILTYCIISVFLCGKCIPNLRNLLKAGQFEAESMPEEVCGVQWAWPQALLEGGENVEVMGLVPKLSCLTASSAACCS